MCHGRHRIHSLSVPLPSDFMPSRGQPSLPVICCRVYDNPMAPHVWPPVPFFAEIEQIPLNHSIFSSEKVRRYPAD